MVPKMYDCLEFCQVLGHDDLESWYVARVIEREVMKVWVGDVSPQNRSSLCDHFWSIRHTRGVCFELILCSFSRKPRVRAQQQSVQTVSEAPSLESYFVNPTCPCPMHHTAG